MDKGFYNKLIEHIKNFTNDIKNIVCTDTFNNNYTHYDTYININDKNNETIAILKNSIFKCEYSLGNDIHIIKKNYNDKILFNYSTGVTDEYNINFVNDSYEQLSSDHLIELLSNYYV